MNTHIPWHKLHIDEMGDLTFRVESEAHKGTYFVDVSIPQCDCADFVCRIAPVLSGKKSPPLNQPAWIASCKHLLRAKLHIADKVIEQLKKHRKEYQGP